MSKAKLKSFGLVVLEEEISKQPGINSIVWLSVFILMRPEMKRSKLSKEKLRRKRAPGSGMGLSPAFKEINR